MRCFFWCSDKRAAVWQAVSFLVLVCASVCAAVAQSPAGTPQTPEALSEARRAQLMPSQAALVAWAPASSPDGRLYLTLQQAFQLALKNNLDIELERVDQGIAEFSVSLTKGGGLPRSINYIVAETPAGEAPVAVPLLSFTSPGLSPLNVSPITSTVSSSYNTSRVLGETRSLSLLPSSYSNGSPVPGFDAQLLGQYGWLRRDPGVAIANGAPSTTPADTAITDNTLANTILTKGFSPGTTIQFGVNNFVQSFYSGRSSAVPFTHPNAYGLVAQPLLRGAGRANNMRYIAIAKTNQKISAAVLEQQTISTIAGVTNLYIDLVSLQDSVKVQEQAVAAAELLLHNDE
jgi:hypothetical protein